jgi:hypothetical protein
MLQGYARCLVHRDRVRDEFTGAGENAAVTGESTGDLGAAAREVHTVHRSGQAGVVEYR